MQAAAVFPETDSHSGDQPSWLPGMNDVIVFGFFRQVISRCQLASDVRMGGVALSTSPRGVVR